RLPARMAGAIAGAPRRRRFASARGAAVELAATSTATSDRMSANANNATRVVFITGGAGFLGINLARYLLARGFSVVSYDIADFSYPERQSISAVTGDIRDFPRLSGAMRGAEIVVHGAAALPSYPTHAIMSTEVDGTRNVLEAARIHGIPRVVHVSSTA